jgi:serine phosphatase RsbU (regulator of sigma subunit)
VRTKALIRFLFLFSAIAWLAFLFSELFVALSVHQGIRPDVPPYLPAVLFCLYLLGVYLHYKLKLERDELLEFTELLWRVFATGLVAALVALVFFMIEEFSGSNRITRSFIYKEFTYLIIMPLWAGYLLINLVVWKRLILYQKTRWSHRLWMTFEYSLAVLLVLSAFPVSVVESFINPLIIVFILLSLIIATNTRWVAYLNFRQKLSAMMLLLIILFFHGLFFFKFKYNVDGILQVNTLGVNPLDHLFLLVASIFITLYGVFSFLVLLFNLPTSSAFEKKLEEAVNFQRISQAIQTEQSEESVYRILLETSVSTLNADAAWLEMKTDNPGISFYTIGIAEHEARSLSARLKENQASGTAYPSDKWRNLSKRLQGSRYRSVVVAPIAVKDEHMGQLVLLKEMRDGFNREMQQIALNFANQAGISIENFRLMEAVLQNERYKEELKIARQVQKSLLPQHLEQDARFEASAFSESADEVGGDYYDTRRLSENQVALIIADVSGKGTSAAFHMSQMKGIFHSLADAHTSPLDFMQRANRALAHCLERNAFISAAYFVIDTHNQVIHYARAGHCPVLYYHAKSNKAAYLHDEGMALGMLRNEGYNNMIRQNTISFQPGDLLVLYTDGITEARNSGNEEFGFERLSRLIAENHHLQASQLVERVIDGLYAFSGTTHINDDYTLLVIKFR